jgi:hypothetical protein
VVRLSGDEQDLQPGAREDKVHKKPEMRTVMVDIFDAVMLKSVGDAVPENIFDKDPGKDKMYKKPELRDGMLETNPKCKYDDDKEVNVRNTKKKDVMFNIINAVMLNTEYKAGVKVHQGREPNMFKKPKKRDVMDGIFNAVMLNTKYEAGVKVH